MDMYTPGLPDGKKHPVMVWIHGGEFAMGAARGSALRAPIWPATP